MFNAKLLHMIVNINNGLRYVHFVNGNEDKTKRKMEDNKMVTPNPVLFVIFAEYLGYESKLIRIAEKVCEEKLPYETFIQPLQREAEYIFNKMQAEYDLTDISYWWKTYYNAALQDYDETLDKIMIQKKDDLPF